MRKVLISMAIVLGVLFILAKAAEMWLEYNLHSMINADPERSYELDYRDVDFDTFLRGITLENVSIRPLNETGGSTITGTVDYATINGIFWLDFAVNGRLSIEEMAYESPKFEVLVGEDTTSKTSGAGMQELFGDLLAGVQLNKFRLQDGSVLIRQRNSDETIGQILNMTIEASGLQTDVVKLNHLIPFELEALSTQIDTAFFKLNEYTDFTIGEFSYQTKKENLSIKNVSLHFTEDWQKVSKRLGVQTDLITFDLGELSISGLESSSSFYSDLDIKAQKVKISNLDLADHRDKNMPRPPDVQKPMFEGMIEAIPIVLKIDTIELQDVNVSYTELGIDKANAGTAHFGGINGMITGITTIPELQYDYKVFKASLEARMNDAAQMSIDLEVPYNKEAFSMTTTVGEMDFEALNSSSVDMADIQFTSGRLDHLALVMDASKTSSRNAMTLNYSNLKMAVVKNNESGKKQGFISAIANGAVRADNLPSDRNYRTAEYITERNIHRGPFNFIWQSVKEGMTRIIPTGAVQKVMGLKKKQK